MTTNCISTQTSNRRMASSSCSPCGPTGGPSNHRVSVDWVIVENKLARHPSYSQSGMLNIGIQGYDRDGLLAKVVRVFKENETNIKNISYKVFGQERAFYDLRIVAADRMERLDAVSAFFRSRPISYYQEAGGLFVPLVVLEYPWRMNVKISVADKPNLVAEIAELVASSVSSSFTRVHGRVLTFRGDEVNDAGFAQGGVPGFLFETQLATATPDERIRVREKLTEFVREQELAWSAIHLLEARPEELFEFRLMQDLGNTERFPTHFVPPRA